MEDHSDLGGMWEQALNDYYAEAGVDLRLLEPARRDMAYIQAEQDRQVLLFSEFRHNKGKVDKLRTLVSANSAMIMKVASHVANAASSAFPPSAAILTAFNYVMNASKAVSDDYDMIVSFFEIMNSFLERISMLEGRMPDVWQFRRFLMNVFQALMTLTSIARKYRTSKGRLVKWAKALVDGQDPKLKGAFDSLHTHLQRFESATMLATLRQAIDTGKKVDTIDRKVDITIQLGEQNMAIGQENLALGQQGISIGQAGLAMGQQNLEVNQESYMQILEIKGSSQELLDIVARQDEDRKKFEASFEKKLTRLGAAQNRDNAAAAGGSTDAGARKSTALKSLASLLGCQINCRRQLEEFDNTFAPGTFEWFKNVPAYAAVRDGETPMLWITGAPGTGKSNLAYLAAKSLQDDLGIEPNTSLAYFFHRDDSEERSIPHMLKSCAYQVAQQDIKYREELLADLQDKNGKSIDEPFHSIIDPIKLMDKLFLSKLSKHSRVPDRRIVLLIDGIDEALVPEPDSFAKLLKWFLSEVQAKAKEKASINLTIVFTSDTAFASLPISMQEPQDRAEATDNEAENTAGTTKGNSTETVEDVLKAATRFELDLTRTRMRKDLRTIALFRMKQQSKLRRLRPEARRKIANKLKGKADSIQYIEHMLRRFNAIGREGPIMRELDNLPANTKAVYQLLLEDCQKSRTDQDLFVLRKFFAWMAYAQEPLKFISGSKLLHHISCEHAISIDEEIEHRSARLLRLAGAAADDNQETDDSDAEFDRGADDGNKSGDEDGHDDFSSEDMDVLLGFQERSLRQYFRQKETDGERGLRTSPSVGHLMILETMSAMLTEDGTNICHSTHQGERLLCEYTTGNWRHHLTEINRADLNNEQAASLIESVHGILSNRNSALLSLEHHLDWDKPSIFGSVDEKHDGILQTLQQWATHATALPSSVLSTGTLEWMRPLIRNPKIVYIRTAEAHVSNWFLNPGEFWSMEKSFLCAHRALELGKDLLQQHDDLRKYFEDWTKQKEEIFNGEPSFREESLLVVAKAFWQMQMTMTAQCYRAIGMAMQSLRLFEPSLKQFELGLENADTDKDRLQIYTAMSTVLLELALQAERDEEDKKLSLINLDKTVARGEEYNLTVQVTKEEMDKMRAERALEPTEKPAEKAEEEPRKELDMDDPNLGLSPVEPADEVPDVPDYKVLTNAEARERISSERDTFAEKKRDYAQRASDIMAKANALDVTFSTDVSQTQDDVLKQAIIDTHMRHSTAELILGNSDNVVAYLVEARKIQMRRCYIDFDDQVKRLSEREEWAKIMDVVAGSDKTNRMYFLLYSDKAAIHAYMRAGKETNKIGDVVGAYQEGITLLSSTNGIARAVGCMLKLADFYMQVLGDDQALARAKALLHQVTNASADPADVTAASFSIADILVEQFRRTNDPTVKMRAHTEMKNLTRQIAEQNMGSDFDPSQSQTNIPLALTTRKLAAVEYQQLLEATFKGCIQALSDDVSYNDSTSFRTLAKVLAVVGLKHDAEIAATCQLYIVDMEVHRKETIDHSAHDSSSDSSSDTEVDGAPVALPNEESTVKDVAEKKEDLPAPPAYAEVQVTSPEPLVNGNATEPEKTTLYINGVGEVEVDAEPPVAIPISAEALAADHGENAAPPAGAGEAADELPPPVIYDVNHFTIQTCSRCDTTCRSGWDDNVFYLCYYCTERTLCSKCYDDKISREKGDQPPDWHIICPKGHQHVKAPVDGWLGVMDGELIFKDDKIKFRHWLTELEHKKWPEVWEEFWSENVQD